MAERVAGAHGEANRHPDPPGSIPMDLEAMQGPSSRSETHYKSGRAGGCSNDKCTYHYCKHPGHFMLSCLKFKWDIETKAAA